MDKITRSYISLIKAIENAKEYSFLSQLKRTGSNRDDIAKIKLICEQMQRDLDKSFNFYLYKEDKWLQMDIYSKAGYEGSIKGGNLHHIIARIRKIYLEALKLLKPS